MPLPVPTDTMRVRFSTTLLKGEAPSDEAQFGFWGVRKHATGTTVDWPNDVQHIAEGIRDRWVEHMTNKGMFSTAVRFDTVSVDHLAAANGSVLDQGVALFDGANAWRGTAGASLPWETSLAVSLYNYTPGQFAPNKGRRRGRFYLPPMGRDVINDVDGQFPISFVGTVASQITDFLNDVQGMHFNDTPGDNGDYFDLSIISRGTPEKQLPPTAYPVNLIRIDTKVDSQRRRERQQAANAFSDGVINHA